MSKKNVEKAVAYYQATHAKDVGAIEKMLHLEVELSSPLAELKGKESVLNSIKQFVLLFNSLNVRAHFGSENQAMVVYDLDCPLPLGLFKGASLLTFRDGLIAKLELFYDSKRVEAKGKEIFAKSH